MNSKFGRIVFLFIPLLIFSSLLSLERGQAVQRPLRIGVVSMITPVGTVNYYQDLIDYIAEQFGRPVEMEYRKTYDEMDRMLEKGSVDAAFICSAPYVEDKRKFGAELLAVPQVDGKPFYKSFLIVHKDSDILSFEELKGRSFAFTDPKSNSGRLYPVYLLAKRGERIEDFFAKYIYSYSHNKSVELVAKKEVEGAAIESLIYYYMQKNQSPYVKQIRIIEQSPDFGVPPIVTTAATPIFLKEKIKEILLNMHQDTEGGGILKNMLIDKFVRADDTNYDSVREMLSFVTKFNATDDVISPAPQSDTVLFGVIPKDNPRIAFEKLQPLMDYLSEKTPYDFELVLQKTYDDTVIALGEGEINMAFLGPLTYLHAKNDYKAISLLKSITGKGESFYRSVIVTKKNSPIKQLSDLKGKSFAFASLKSTSGNLIPRYLLAEHGIHLRELKNFNNFNYHDSVVKWVLKGIYDAGAVRESVAEKYLPLGLEIIARSGPIPTGPLVISPQTSYTIVETIKTALLDMNKTEYGQKVLQNIDPEFMGGFTEADDFDYAHIRKMINSIPQSCGLGCHPKIQL
ncbi:MAG: phosphate/phosphite/phosphonate ABC transporter substrate-binding protein [Proteobacteria bacterium]|nr:phosphate/phosphite/phosphonate ABC transporter substrate-binding protein [Pseudomonadota bacterium]